MTATSTGINDPDAGAAGCTLFGTTADCAGVTTTSIQGSGGADVLSCMSLAFGFGITLNGGDGNDQLSKGTCDATLTGGLGDETLTGGSGFDTFAAELGADTYIGGSAPTDGASYGDFIADGGNLSAYQSNYATDSIISGGTDAVNVSLDGVANDGRSGENDNVGADVESVYGSAANDALTAGSGSTAVTLYGALGDDTVSSSPSDDSLDGGGGADTITGGDGDDYIGDGDNTLSRLPPPGDPATPAAGADALNGGAGDDSFAVNEGADNVVGGTGEDTVTFGRLTTLAYDAPVTASRSAIGFTISLDDVANDGATGANEGDNTHADVENVASSSGGDVLTGSAVANSLNGGAGKDTLTGGLGPDILTGSAGDDTFNAQDGFTDQVLGGKGNDTAVVDLAGGQAERPMRSAASRRSPG
jgi:Ca2+-binding RTX toxin-like protein